MNNRPTCKKTVSVVLLALVLSISCIRRSEGLRQSDVEPLINTLVSMHVTNNSFNDTISERTLNNLLLTLEPWKLYFTAEDYTRFSCTHPILTILSVQETIPFSRIFFLCIKPALMSGWFFSRLWSNRTTTSQSMNT
jgi:hypothetical protein